MLESALFTAYLLAWLFAGVYASTRLLRHLVADVLMRAALGCVAGSLALFPAVGVWWLVAGGLA